MMLKIFLISICPLFVQGQVLKGTYKSGNQYILFHSDTATFHLVTGGCLVYEYHASGKFQLINNQLIIRPFIDEIKEDIISIARQSDDSLSIEVLAFDNKEVQPSIILYDHNGKVLYGTTLAPKHKMFLSNKYLELADSIQIASIGYAPIGFKLKKNVDYKVLMKTTSKADYENFFNSNGNGFKVKLEENKISLYRTNLNCKGTNYCWQTFVLE